MLVCGQLEEQETANAGTCDAETYKRGVKGACQALKTACAATLQQLSPGSLRLEGLCSAIAGVSGNTSCGNFVVCVETELAKAKCESDTGLSSGVKSIRSQCSKMQGLSPSCIAEISSSKEEVCNDANLNLNRKLADHVSDALLRRTGQRQQKQWQQYIDSSI